MLSAFAAGCLRQARAWQAWDAESAAREDVNRRASRYFEAYGNAILRLAYSYVASLTSSMSDSLYYDYTGRITAIYGKAILTAIIVCVVILVIVTVAEWRIFKKAGQPGWAAMIPFYNDYINYKIFWGNGFLFLLSLVLSVLCRLPVIGVLAVIADVIFYGATQYKKSEAFGHGLPFAVGLFICPLVFEMILAFGKDRYLGIPQDGFSYDQLKEKYGKNWPKMENVTFTQPSAEKEKPDITYTTPETPEQDSKTEDAETPQNG